MYRVMEPPDKEDGQYYFVQKGAILANDFFTESMFRKNWDTPEEYREFLVRETLDYVVIEQEYVESFQTNELDLLQEIVRRGEAKVDYEDPHLMYIVFDVRATTKN